MKAVFYNFDLYFPNNDVDYLLMCLFPNGIFLWRNYIKLSGLLTFLLLRSMQALYILDQLTYFR